MPVRLVPAEEMIWSKAFIMERERFDGADIAHLLRRRRPTAGLAAPAAPLRPHWRVLLGSPGPVRLHLSRASAAPCRRGVMHELASRRLQARAAPPPPGGAVCQGTLLSREQYLTDSSSWGYEDARLAPRGPMTRDEIARWTAAIERAERATRRVRRGPLRIAAVG